MSTPPLPTRASDWVLADAFIHWLATFPNTNTRKTYASSAQPFVSKYAHYLVTDLLRIHVQVYVTDLQSRDAKPSHRGHPRAGKKLSLFTIAKDLKTIKGFLEWLHKMFPREVDNLGDWIRVPALPDRLHREDDIISEDEFQKMLKVADTPLKQLVLHLLWSSGARIGELTTMTLEKTNLTHRTAMVVKKGKKPQGNGFVERQIYFSPECALVMYEWLRVRPQANHDYLLCNAKKPYNYYTVPASLSQIVRRLAEKAELGRPIRGHRFRKTITRRLIREFDLATAALVLGDSTIVTAKHYVVGLREDARKAVDELAKIKKPNEEASKILPFRRAN